MRINAGKPVNVVNGFEKVDSIFSFERNQPAVMGKVSTFEELKVWQKSRELAKAVFQNILSNEKLRDFPYKDQINRSSGSIMDNIAEGFGRGGNKEFINFLGFANGSSDELRSQLYRGLDRRHITKEQFDSMYNLAIEVSKMTVGLINYLRKSEIKGPKFMVNEDPAPYGSLPPED